MLFISPNWVHEWVCVWSLKKRMRLLATKPIFMESVWALLLGYIIITASKIKNYIVYAGFISVFFVFFHHSYWIVSLFVAEVRTSRTQFCIMKFTCSGQNVQSQAGVQFSARYPSNLVIHWCIFCNPFSLVRFAMGPKPLSRTPGVRWNPSLNGRQIRIRVPCTQIHSSSHLGEI